VNLLFLKSNETHSISANALEHLFALVLTFSRSFTINDKDFTVELLDRRLYTSMITLGSLK
jgi:hypothetical protein